MGVAGPEAERGLASGEYQMAQLELARDQTPGAGDGFAVQTRGTLYVKYLAFDLGRARTPFVPLPVNPFLDRRVREAIHLGLDRERLVGRLPTRGIPASQLVPRDIFGFAPSLPDPRHDPERARALLREAGFAGGFSATLHTRAILQDTGAIVKEQLAEVGIQLQVEVMADSDHFAALEAHDLSLWLDRWSCTTGESAELFETALHSRDEARGLGLYNESQYRNPTLDAAIERALELEAPADRGRALQALMAQVMQDLPWLPLYSDEEVWGLQNGYAWLPQVDFWLRLQDIHPTG
jgi:peptide/nickel transport system substrate-binding protein